MEHPLRTWRERNGLSLDAVARAINARGGAKTVWRYENGSIPGSKNMISLIALTGGELSANDFYQFNGAIASNSNSTPTCGVTNE